MERKEKISSQNSGVRREHSLTGNATETLLGLEVLDFYD